MAQGRRLGRVSCIAAAAWLLAGAAQVQAQGLAQGLAQSAAPAPATSPYGRVVVFGDSLADSGNNALWIGADPGQVITGDAYFAMRPYASGRYSNGPVWAELFAERLGLSATASQAGGSNFANGGGATGQDGSGTPIPGFPFSMRSQVNHYLATVPLSGSVTPAQSLFVFSGGAVNVSHTMEAVAQNPNAASQLIAEAAQRYAEDMGAMVDQLQAAGAQHILLLNVGDFGLTPRAQSYGASAAAAATGAAMAMNEALLLRMEDEAGVQIFDLFGMLGQVVGHPDRYGLSNVNHACGAAENRCDPATALFYDGQHPTAFGHQLIANQVFAAAVPEPASAALLLSGLAGVLALSRRRSVRALAP